MFEFDFEQLEEEESPREKFQPGDWTQTSGFPKRKYLSIPGESYPISYPHHIPFYSLINGFYVNLGSNLPCFGRCNRKGLGGANFFETSTRRDHGFPGYQQKTTHQWLCKKIRVIPCFTAISMGNMCFFKNQFHRVPCFLTITMAKSVIRGVKRHLTWLGKMCLTHAIPKPSFGKKMLCMCIYSIV